MSIDPVFQVDLIIFLVLCPQIYRIDYFGWLLHLGRGLIKFGSEKIDKCINHSQTDLIDVIVREGSIRLFLSTLSNIDSQWLVTRQRV